jgi:hypothetical protein
LFATSASPIGSVVPERPGVSHTDPIFRDNTPRKSGVLTRITFPLQHAAKAAFRKSARSRQWRGQAGATEFVRILLGEDAIDRRICTNLLERNDEWAVERGRHQVSGKHGAVAQ